MGLTVADVMTPGVRVVGKEAPLKEVAALLVAEHITGVPVCDDSGRVVGVVSAQDILLKEYDPTEARGGPLAWLADGTDYSWVAKARATTAAEAMTSPAVTIGPGASIAQAARTMVERGVNRLPVVEDGRLAGIVTRTDLVRAFARPDVDVAREIRKEIVDETLGLAGRISVLVDQGHVTLLGQVDARRDVAVIERLVRRVPGVVSLRSHLTWRVDDAGAMRALGGADA